MASQQPAQKQIFVRNATGLVRQISGLDALGMALSGMGLLYVYNVVAFTPGFYPTANPLVSEIVGFLLVLPIALMYAIMAIAMPRTGGDYVWVGRTLGPSVGFVTNFVITAISLSFVGTVAPQFTDWAISPTFYDLGKIYNNAGYLSTANYLQTIPPTFAISVVCVVGAGLIVLANVKLARTAVRWYTYASFVIGAIFVITVLAAGNHTFINNFNSLSGANYTGVITEGQQAGAYNGVPPVFSSSTLYAGALAILGFLSFYYPAYFAGETKQNRSTQILAQVGGAVIFTVFTTIIIFVEYFGEGPSFVNAMAALWNSGSSSLPYITIPMASGMSMFWTQNPVLVTLFNMSYGTTILFMDVAIFFTLTRNLFAWSFDRVVPKAFADINERTQTPVYATLIMILGALFFTYIAEYQFGLLASIFSYGTAGICIGFLIVSIAAIIFPFKRRDIFEGSDSLAKKKLGGLPIISLLGVISLIVSAISVYAIVLPSIGGPFLKVFAEGILPTFIIGGAIYAIAWILRKRSGINLSLLQREIPPE